MTHSDASPRKLVSMVDAAWLRMDTPTNPMVITALLTFVEPLDFDALLDVVRERLLCHDRFRERPESSRLPGGRPSWEPDPTFDVASHVHRIGLPAGGDARALFDVVSDLMSTPLDHTRPLWQMLVIDRPGGGSSVVVRLHHGIADGVALVGVLMGLTTEGAPAHHEAHAPPRPRPDGVAAALRAHGEEARTLVHLLALPFDPPSAFRGELGVRKRAAWSEPAPLAALKRVARSVDGTVNDVLLACAAAAVREYLGTRAPQTEAEELRALIPVNLRAAGEQGGLGNEFGLVFLALPLSVADPLKRIRVVKERMDRIKHSPEAGVALGVLASMGIVSTAIERLGVDIFSRKATFMITNVTGPPAPVHLAGSALDSVVVFAPVSGTIGVGFSFFSYAGAIRLGVAADHHLVPDPDAIAAAFDREVASLVLASG